MRQWHQGKEGFMKVTRIQDKYNLSSDEMEALVEHREKLDAELEQLRENRMELEAEIEGKENALNIIDKIIEETEVSY